MSGQRQSAPRPYPYRWWWRKMLPDRHASACRIVGRVGDGEVLVEFEADGLRVRASRYAVRRVRE